MACGDVVTSLLYDCDNKGTGGLIQEIKLVNLSKIKEYLLAFTVLNTDSKHTITAFTGTAANFKAVQVKGIPNKQLLTAGFKTSDSDYGIFNMHEVQLFAQSLTEKSAVFLKSFINGAEVVAFVKQKDGGLTGEETFWVYGWTNGLKLGEASYNTAVNSGTFTIPLTSKEPDLEPNPPYRLLITDVATTNVFWNSLV